MPSRLDVLRFFFCLLPLVYTTGVGAEVPAPFSINTDDPSIIKAKLSGYTLKINREPYGLNIMRGSRPVAQNPDGGGTAFYRNDNRYLLKRVQEYRDFGDGIALKVSTTVPGLFAEVILTLFEDNILVRWSLDDGKVNSRMEEGFRLEAGGHWYGGNVTSGHQWPLETAEVVLDPFLATSNQTTPFWLTSAGTGYYIPTYRPMGFSIDKNRDGLFSFNVKDSRVLEYRILIGKDILQVYDSFVSLNGRPRAIPPEGYFTKPIFNTWIEFKKDVNQAGMLEYARTLRRWGFGCEVFMIDDMWQTHYGDNVFNPAKFPDPKSMVETMHEMGFKVILWKVPFVDFDSGNFSFLKEKNFLVLDRKGKKPAGIRWWNGESALVDLSNPEAFSWFTGELKRLQAVYGIDGFKLDAGDAQYFDPGFVSYGNITPNRYTDLFAEVGTHFSINELRVSWLAQSMGLVQRLRDKNNNWNRATGLGALIPHGLTESLIGYVYFCPDIIGGGEGGDFQSEKFRGMDPELFIRWTQASALMPMMQFSYAPWNLDEESTRICLRYARLHEQLGNYIYSLAIQAQETGRPIIRPLFFRNPEDENTYLLDDQFMLGDRLLVAPVLEKGARTRDVYLPAGLWKDFFSGEIYKGKQTLDSYPAALEKLPLFVNLD